MRNRGMDRCAAVGALLLLQLAALAVAGGNVKGGGHVGGYEGDESAPVVRVREGSLRGRRVQREPSSPLQTLWAFEGVPYGRPPLGPLRFKDPEAAAAWSGVRNATAYGSACVGTSLDFGGVTGSEDCLYLNIYTADPPSQWRRRRQPVLVWVHGGAFVQGSGEMSTRRPDSLLQLGVLFVSLNFRLGVLGHLNTEDAHAPGNAGFKDQALALRWVQSNIAAFGGDPARVTLMGESSGGGSVHYHMLSPLTAGLFQRAVAVSGSALPNWALVAAPRQKAQALRDRWASACPAADGIVQCLQRVDAGQLFTSQFEVRENENEFFGPNPFRPSVEVEGASATRFVVDNPEKLLREGAFHKVPYMTGFTSAEGIIYLGFGRLLTDPSRYAELDRDFAQIFRPLLPLGVPRTLQSARALRSFYLGNRTLDNDLDTEQKIVEMCRDTFFAEGAVQSARLMAAAGGEVYLYEFSHDGPAGYWKRYLNATRFAGVSHGDDLFYVFDRVGDDGQLPQFPPEENRIRQRQAQIFAHFVKTGNPNPPDSGIHQWRPYKASEKSFLQMDTELMQSENPLGDSMAFWRRLMRQTKA